MNLDELSRYLPFMIPVILLQIILMLVALIDLARREQTRGPKWVWLVVVLLFNIFGPILYLLFGRRDE